MKAIILCAGKGERLKPLTDTIPKPLVPIAGRHLLEYNLLLLKHHNIKEICINTSYLADKIKDYINNKNLGLKINYSFELELLGTSGALNNFREILTEPFVVIYGDNLTDIDLTKMIAHHNNTKALVTIALRKKPKEYKTGSLIIADNNLKITKFIEKPSEEEINKFSGDYKLINSGIYICEPEILDFIPPGVSDFAYNIFPKILNTGKNMQGFMMDEYHFREVGKMEKYQLAKEEIESGKVKLSFL